MMNSFALKRRGGREGGTEGASGGGRFHFWQDVQM